MGRVHAHTSGGRRDEKKNLFSDVKDLKGWNRWDYAWIHWNPLNKIWTIVSITNWFSIFGFTLHFRGQTRTKSRTTVGCCIILQAEELTSKRIKIDPKTSLDFLKFSCTVKKHSNPNSSKSNLFKNILVTFYQSKGPSVHYMKILQATRELSQTGGSMAIRGNHHPVYLQQTFAGILPSDYKSTEKMSPNQRRSSTSVCQSKQLIKQNMQVGNQTNIRIVNFDTNTCIPFYSQNQSNFLNKYKYWLFSKAVATQQHNKIMKM